MADIFISYSKGQRSVTEDLARELQAKGYSVWWDTALVSGENYRTVILAELAKARAVIVIWTTDSVKSDWVISEATRARARGILLPFRDPGIDPDAVPPPFDTLHTDEVTNRAAILSALARLGLTPNPSGAADTSGAEAAAWHYAQERSAAEDFHAFLAAYPSGRHAKAAEAALAKLRGGGGHDRRRPIIFAVAALAVGVFAGATGALLFGTGGSTFAPGPSKTSGRTFVVELNAIETDGKRCRLTFALSNKADDPINSMIVDFTALGANKQLLHRFLAELGPVRPHRSIVRTFALDFECGRLAALRVNEITECGPASIPQCLDMIDTASRIKNITFN